MSGQIIKAVQRYNKLSDELMQRIASVKPNDVTLSGFIELLLDHYLGANCNHENQHLCLVLPVDKFGYLDVGESHDLIESINVGRKPEEIYRICLDCNRVKRIFK